MARSNKKLGRKDKDSSVKEQTPKEDASKMLSILQLLSRKQAPNVVDEEDEYGLTPPKPYNKRYLR